ncbi:hypothetical protein NBO_85g0003 [Nosema bombycis CQ1]|uniref:Uncharacterized protein n=1 Tax=Nosema bombycis (strain CQ1 / CVCC 102059) TaxID=578461 RepID=R0M5J4_NOSB1|nr:hypothetical protein NBO_85g0003 [Nosema bombycis CQ1]|eukprot:EOB13274.1 hypothetical protein NBO_85g0003 [Nosema bombycis CQ1]
MLKIFNSFNCIPLPLQMNVDFNLFKNYINQLETLEKLFLLYSKEKHEKLTLLLIKNKYKKILKGRKYTKEYDEKYFKKKTIKIKNKIKKIKNGFTKGDDLKNILWLIKNKKFIKKYILIGNMKKMIKGIDLIENVEYNCVDDDSLIVCLNCKIQLKFKLLKYHLKSKKHKKLRKGKDKIGRLVGDMNKGEEIIEKIKMGKWM